MTTDLVALQADVDSLTGELLSRYEEITLLYDLAREMGVVLDIEGASRTALARSLQVIPAEFGLVLVGSSPADLQPVASAGSPGPEDRRGSLAREAAAEALRTGSQVLAKAGEPIGNDHQPCREPVLAYPLLTAGPAAAEASLAGALAFIGHDHHDRFSAADAQLCAVVAGQLAQGITNARVIDELREKERLESDLALAAQIQGSLLPRDPPQLPGAELAGRCLPATEVGGDYYDFLVDDSGAVCLIVGDVSGHGLGPGLIMAMTRSVLRAELRRFGTLSDALAATNAVMWDDLVATEAFITLFAARFQPETGDLHYVNAGHQPALLRHRDGSIEELAAGGLPLGILPEPSYATSSRRLAPGDAVLVFSDGVVEATAPGGEQLGRSGLEALVREAHTGSAESLVTRVLEHIQSWQVPGVQEDDMTIVGLCLGDGSESRRQG